MKSSSPSLSLSFSHFVSVGVFLSCNTRYCCALFGVRLGKVLSLRSNGISACMVGGSSDLRTEEKAIAGEFPLVFVTPEKVLS